VIRGLAGEYKKIQIDVIVFVVAAAYFKHPILDFLL